MPYTLSMEDIAECSLKISTRLWDVPANNIAHFLNLIIIENSQEHIGTA